MRQLILVCSALVAVALGTTPSLTTQERYPCGAAPPASVYGQGRPDCLGKMYQLLGGGGPRSGGTLLPQLSCAGKAIGARCSTYDFRSEDDRCGVDTAAGSSTVNHIICKPGKRRVCGSDMGPDSHEPDEPQRRRMVSDHGHYASIKHILALGKEFLTRVTKPSVDYVQKYQPAGGARGHRTLRRRAQVVPNTTRVGNDGSRSAQMFGELIGAKNMPLNLWDFPKEGETEDERQERNGKRIVDFVVAQSIFPIFLFVFGVLTSCLCCCGLFEYCGLSKERRIDIGWPIWETYNNDENDNTSMRSICLYGCNGGGCVIVMIMVLVQIINHMGVSSDMIGGQDSVYTITKDTIYSVTEVPRMTAKTIGIDVSQFFDNLFAGSKRLQTVYGSTVKQGMSTITTPLQTVRTKYLSSTSPARRTSHALQICPFCDRINQKISTAVGQINEKTLELRQQLNNTLPAAFRVLQWDVIDTAKFNLYCADREILKLVGSMQYLEDGSGDCSKSARLKDPASAAAWEQVRTTAAPGCYNKEGENKLLIGDVEGGSTFTLTEIVSMETQAFSGLSALNILPALLAILSVTYCLRTCSNLSEKEDRDPSYCDWTPWTYRPCCPTCVGCPSPVCCGLFPTLIFIVILSAPSVFYGDVCEHILTPTLEQLRTPSPPGAGGLNAAETEDVNTYKGLIGACWDHRPLWSELQRSKNLRRDMDRYELNNNLISDLLVTANVVDSFNFDALADLRNDVFGPNACTDGRSGAGPFVGCRIQDSHCQDQATCSAWNGVLGDYKLAVDQAETAAAALKGRYQNFENQAKAFGTQTTTQFLTTTTSILNSIKCPSTFQKNYGRIRTVACDSILGWMNLWIISGYLIMVGFMFQEWSITWMIGVEAYDTEDDSKTDEWDDTRQASGSNVQMTQDGGYVGTDGEPEVIVMHRTGMV